MSKGIKIITIGFLILSQTLSQELESLDQMWDNTKWEEIQEVIVKEYKIEKVTQTAGVRGKEAESEPLEYLYYRLNSKTNEIPYKLFILLSSDMNTH